MQISFAQRKIVAATLFALLFMIYNAQAGQPAGAQPNQPFAPAIDEQAARGIALDQVKAGKVAAIRLRVKDDGRALYKVLMVDGDARVKLEVDAVTGQVTKFERENIESVKYPRGWQGSPADGQTGLDAAAAREKALEKTGGGMVVKVEKEFKRDGRIVYEVEVVDADREYEVKLDGRTGDVIEYEEEMPRRFGN